MREGKKDIITKMKKRIIYLDTNIFIIYFLKRVGYIQLKNFFRDNEDLEVEFVTSDWTLTEIVKVLTIEYKKSAKQIADFIQKLKREKRLFETKFYFIEVSEKREYDFNEFFFHLQKVILQYKGGLADSIHSLIMKNNNIKTILTTDLNFQGRKGVIIINPLKQ